MRLRHAIRGFWSAALLLIWPLAAVAQPQGSPPCAGVTTPVSAIRFDNGEHRAWYLRFWTGDCAGTHSFCMPGSPNWLTTVAYVTEHALPAERQALVARTCRLGQQIGLEWSREAHVKRITVSDLREFGAIMKRTRPARPCSAAKAERQ